MKNTGKKIAVGLLTTTIVASQIFPTSLSLSESLSGGHLAEAAVANDYFSDTPAQTGTDITMTEANGKLNIVVNLTKLSIGGTIRINIINNVGGELYNYGVVETPTTTGVKTYTLDKKVDVPKFGLINVSYYTKSGSHLSTRAYVFGDGLTSASQDLSNATNLVDTLFTDSNKYSLKLTTDQAAIDEAQAAVDKLAQGTDKTNLQNDINKAKELLAKQTVDKATQYTAKTSVDALFTDATKTGIKPTTDQAAIDVAQALVNKVQDPTVKADLQKDIDKAQSLLDARTQQATDDLNQKAAASYAVNQLFVNNTPASDAIKASADQDAIDNAQAEIDKIKDPVLKVSLQKDMDRAQELLNQRNAPATEKTKQDAARKAVNELFINQTPTSNEIDEYIISQKAIDDAQKLIDVVTDPTVREVLQKDLEQAQSLFDTLQVERAKQDAAIQAIIALFTDNSLTSNTIKDTADQKAIDGAQQLVDALTNPTVQELLQEYLDKAQGLLDAKNAAATEKAKQDAAKKAVDELFNSNTPTSGAIKPTTDQKAIDDAKKLVDAITDLAVKAERQADLDKAQNLLDAKNTTLTAPKVNGYGVTDEYITGKVDASTVTVELYINGVRKKVSTPTNGDFKLYAQGFGLKVGDTFEVRGVDAKGNKGPIATGTVLSSSSSVAYGLTANGAGLSATTITGTAGSGLTTVRLSIDGTIVKVGQIKADGTYSISTNNLIKPGSKVEVVGYADKTEMARKTVNIVNDEKPVLDALTMDDDTLKGSVTAGSATGFRVSINGVAVKTGAIAADGTFQSSIGKQAAGTVIKIEIRDTTGYNTLRVASTTVTGSAVVKLTAPVLEKMDGNYIVGTAPKGTELITIYENGAAVRTQSIRTMTVNPDGSFTFKAYVAASATSIQVQAKNSDKRMTSDLSAVFTK